VRAPGHARQQLVRLLDAGMTGTYHALAAAAGVSPDAAQSVLWELSRTGAVDAEERTARSRPATYRRSRGSIDALAFTRQAWR
jgi:predicted ArsR family transcriptional regulator